jgi:diacylglycerol kinase family enzyme
MPKLKHMENYFKNVLIIANPTSQTGKGAVAAEVALRELRAHMPSSNVTLALTTHANHAQEIAQAAAQNGTASTIVAVGGDGTIHEVVNGLMLAKLAQNAESSEGCGAPAGRVAVTCPASRPSNQPPALAVIPVGSGNDYARATHMSTNVYTACKQIAAATPAPVDVGRVNSHFFMETLSFGLDAAIALDTVQRRIKTGHTGTRLYMESGFDQLFHHLDSRPYTAHFDAEGVTSNTSITFAVQIGPYYGGGFKVCPQAKIDNGMLDICIAHPPLGTADAAALFVRAKAGLHTKNKQIEIRQCKKLVLDFETQPPAQMDGEEICATHFDIEVIPGALTLLRP